MGHSLKMYPVHVVRKERNTKVSFLITGRKEMYQHMLLKRLSTTQRKLLRIRVRTSFRKHIHEWDPLCTGIHGKRNAHSKIISIQFSIIYKVIKSYSFCLLHRQFHGAVNVSGIIYALSLTQVPEGIMILNCIYGHCWNLRIILNPIEEPHEMSQWSGCY
jgi:hypothetical protein